MNRNNSFKGPGLYLLTDHTRKASFFHNLEIGIFSP